MEWHERFKKSTVIDLSRGSVDLNNFLHCSYAVGHDVFREVYRFIKIEHNVAMATDARIVNFSLLYHDYDDGYYLVYRKNKTSIIMYKINIEHPVEDLGLKFPDIYSVIPQEKRTKTIMYKPNSIGRDAMVNKALPSNSGVTHELLNKIKFDGTFYLPEEDSKPLFFIDIYKTMYSILMPFKLRSDE